MRVTFLGTGSAMATAGRAQTGIVLTDGEGRADPLLVDCGSGVLGRLARTDLSYEGVDTVLLTHHHLDHVSDLLALLKARWLAGEETLTVVGPAGTADLVEGLLDVHDYLRDRVALTLREVGPGTDAGATPGDPFSVAGYRVHAMETRHSMDCLAYRFRVAGDGGAAGDSVDDDPARADGEATDPGGPAGEGRPPPTFTFSGDSEAFPELVEFADGSAVLAHDCSFPDDVAVDNHPTPTELGAALADADADLGRVYLTHLYPHTEGRHESMVESVRRRWDDDVRVAEDMTTVSIE